MVVKADAGRIGRACLIVGAGRTKTTDRIDHAAGVSDIRKIGESVGEGDLLAVVHSNSKEAIAEAKNLLLEAFVIGDRLDQPANLIMGEVQ